MPKPGPRTPPRYSTTFKATAVRLSQMPGVAVQDVAQSLYIHPFMLSRCLKIRLKSIIDHLIKRNPEGWPTGV